MGCAAIDTRQGRIFLCDRSARKAAPCSVCGTRPHTRLCDRCDARLCDECAVEIGRVEKLPGPEVRAIYDEATEHPEEVVRRAEVDRRVREHPVEIETVDLCPKCNGTGNLAAAKTLPVDVLRELVREKEAEQLQLELRVRRDH